MVDDEEWASQELAGSKGIAVLAFLAVEVVGEVVDHLALFF